MMTTMAAVSVLTAVLMMMVVVVRLMMMGRGKMPRADNCDGHCNRKCEVAGDGDVDGGDARQHNTVHYDGDGDGDVATTTLMVTMRRGKVSRAENSDGDRSVRGRGGEGLEPEKRTAVGVDPYYVKPSKYLKR